MSCIIGQYSQEFGGSIMPNDPDKLYHHPPRLRGYDYSQAGFYYVTINTQERQHFFGEVIGGRLHLNDNGEIVQSIWDDLPRRFPGVTLDTSILMPNHLHGIIVQSGEAKAKKFAPTLHQIIRAFKAVSTRLIHQSGSSEFCWQSNFYEHIIRKNGELDAIRSYIVTNPVRWSLKRGENIESEEE